MSHFLALFALIFMSVVPDKTVEPPVKVVVMGLTHGHAPWIFNSKADFIVVGIYEPDGELASNYARQYKLPKNLFFDDAEAMLLQTKPEAVLGFGSIFDHLEVVRLAAPKGIHIMLEKPMSAWLAHADEMKALAQKHGIHLLTNYETSWYANHEAAYQMVVKQKNLGNFTKAVFHHGHKGPKEIGVGSEFLSWLTDPEQNGGGAMVDFGCYGANIMTYLMEGKKPVSVTALTQNFKPEIYSKVDDECTIILDYGDAQAIIQASWNWPFDRKDMELYGSTGYLTTSGRTGLQIRLLGEDKAKSSEADAETFGVYEDPFSYLIDVIRGKVKVEPFSPYDLKNNLVVVEILEAARLSAKKGQTVYLD
jgi:predicted dehydrogenase